jgi:hypothetical protein
LPKEATGIKRYTLTEKGRIFFEENAKVGDELQKKVAPIGPLFFLRMGLHADGMQRLQEPVKRFFGALFDLRDTLRDNLTDQALAEVEQLLNVSSEKIENLNERIKGG